VRDRFLLASLSGGLGNRMRVLLSAESYAHYTARKFAYVWPVDGAFNGELDELWQYGGHQLNPPLSRAISLAWPVQELRVGDTLLDKHKFLHIRTVHELNLPARAVPWRELLRALPPSPRVAELVTSFWQSHLAGVPYVGFMVRANGSAHGRTRLASPVGWFVDRMKEIRACDSEIRIFLSCDDRSVSAAIGSEVPGVLTLPKTGGFNSSQGLIEAVADLYLLAGSDHIVGPYWSSFAELAMSLGDSSLRLETALTLGPTALPPFPRRLIADPLRPWRTLGHRPQPLA
jgi:hypothetical protein